MPKKIFDIIPPSGERKTKETYQEKTIVIRKTVNRPDFKKEVVEHIERKEVRTRKSPRIFKKFLAVCLFVLILGFAGLVLNSLLSIKVKVKVWPKIDSFAASRDMSADLSAKTVDYEKGILPGQEVKDSKSQEKEFSATGRKDKEEKAKGTIRVYNSYSDASQVLVSGTRFVSADGKLFKTTAKQTIAGGKYVGGKLVAGETDVSVEAAEAGEAYNIGPTTFSIPGFVGTPKYTAFYGKSFSAMSGGAKKEVSVVLQDDIDKAEASVLDEAKKSGLESLKSSVSGDLVLLDGAVSQAAREKSSSAKAGDEAEKFISKATVDLVGLAFRKSDMQAFAEILVKAGIPKENEIKSDSVAASYIFKSVSFKDKEMSSAEFNASISAKSYMQLDLEKIKESFLGKSFEEVKNYLSESSLKISKVEISPGLFWRKNVPQDGRKVDISLGLSE